MGEPSGQVSNWGGGRRVRVGIDVEKVRANLSREDAPHPVTDADVRQFLLDAGFRPDGDAGTHWIAAEFDVGHLDADEVTDAEVLGE